MRSDIISAIKYRLGHPQEIPGNSWCVVYRSDIETLLKLIEEMQDDQRAKDAVAVHAFETK